MNLLLTHAYFLEEDEKEKLIMKPYVPLGILYISAYLEEHAIEHAIFDTTFSSFDALKKQIETSKPDLIAIYVNLMTRINVLKLIKWIRTTEALCNTKIILGGPEVKHHAEDLLHYGAAIIVSGEAEQTMLEICNYYKQHGQLPVTVDGTIYMDAEGKVIANAERKLLKDMNQLPPPNRKKINLQNYLNAWKTAHGYSTVSISTMRGCPYTCKWCSRAVYGGTYRRRSPQLVAEEIKQIKEAYNPDRIWFVDDVFTINHKWLREFAAAIKEKQIIIPYEIITRADRMDEEVIRLLKESGCYRVWIGAESGSQKIIDAMDRRVEVTKVREMILLAKKYGIEAGTFIMLGYPGETTADIKETINHLKLSSPDYYTVTIAYPIKGTALHEEVKDKILTNTNWEIHTDRDVDFKRNYSKRFYEYAVRWVYNEVELHKQGSSLRKIKLMAKSIVSRWMMMYEQIMYVE
jgi:anaerobic magnesium-protoporphyrin IX monomethyl ester cyclase